MPILDNLKSEIFEVNQSEINSKSFQTSEKRR